VNSISYISSNWFNCGDVLDASKASIQRYPLSVINECSQMAKGKTILCMIPNCVLPAFGHGIGLSACFSEPVHVREGCGAAAQYRATTYHSLP